MEQLVGGPEGFHANQVASTGRCLSQPPMSSTDCTKTLPIHIHRDRALHERASVIREL
jgi:hypothetical protein